MDFRWAKQRDVRSIGAKRRPASIQLVPSQQRGLRPVIEVVDLPIGTCCRKRK
jgi:hypothetical protein